MLIGFDTRPRHCIPLLTFNKHIQTILDSAYVDIISANFEPLY